MSVEPRGRRRDDDPPCAYGRHPVGGSLEVHENWGEMLGSLWLVAEHPEPAPPYRPGTYHVPQLPDVGLTYVCDLCGQGFVTDHQGTSTLVPSMRRERPSERRRRLDLDPWWITPSGVLLAIALAVLLSWLDVIQW